MKRFVRAGALIALLVGCSPIQQRTDINRPATGIGYSSVGDVVLRVSRSEDLPNIYGRADLFGRTRDRGFTEVRYMGMNVPGQPIFRRRDVDFRTNETTMSQTGSYSLFQAGATATRAGTMGNAQYNALGTSYLAPTASIETLPPDTVEFTLNLSQNRNVTMGSHGFEVIEATTAGVQFRAY